MNQPPRKHIEQTLKQRQANMKSSQEDLVDSDPTSTANLAKLFDHEAEDLLASLHLADPTTLPLPATLFNNLDAPMVYLLYRRGDVVFVSYSRTGMEVLRELVSKRKRAIMDEVSGVGMTICESVAHARVLADVLKRRYEVTSGVVYLI